MNPGSAPQVDGLVVLDHEQLRPTLDPYGPMPVILTGWDKQTIPGLESNNAPVEVDAQRPSNYVAQVANIAPVLRTITGLEFHEAHLPRSLAIDLLPHVRPDLLPLDVVKGDFVWAHGLHLGLDRAPARRIAGPSACGNALHASRRRKCFSGGTAMWTSGARLDPCTIAGTPLPMGR